VGVGKDFPSIPDAFDRHSDTSSVQKLLYDTGGPGAQHRLSHRHDPLMPGASAGGVHMEPSTALSLLSSGTGVRGRPGASFGGTHVEPSSALLLLPSGAGSGGRLDAAGANTGMSFSSRIEFDLDAASASSSGAAFAGSPDGSRLPALSVAPSGGGAIYDKSRISASLELGAALQNTPSAYHNTAAIHHRAAAEPTAALPVPLPSPVSDAAFHADSGVSEAQYNEFLKLLELLPSMDAPEPEGAKGAGSTGGGGGARVGDGGAAGGMGGAGNAGAQSDGSTVAAAAAGGAARADLSAEWSTSAFEPLPLLPTAASAAVTAAPPVNTSPACCSLRDASSAVSTPGLPMPCETGCELERDQNVSSSLALSPPARVQLLTSTFCAMVVCVCGGGGGGRLWTLKFASLRLVYRSWQVHHSNRHTARTLRQPLHRA
jgi:hypothetical protein